VSGGERAFLIAALIGAVPVAMVVIVALLRGYSVVIVLHRDRAHRRQLEDD
jgi:hypothetical protein